MEPPEADLREAIRCHAEASRHQWRTEVSRAPASAGGAWSRVIRLDLTPTDAVLLAKLIRRDASRYSDGWLGTTQVAELLRVKPSTIRGWVARGMPKGNPFPRPGQFLRRNRWRKTTIDAWSQRQAEIDVLKKGEVEVPEPPQTPDRGE